MLDFKEMAARLKQSLTDLDGKRILIFGDVGLDEYVQGAVHRISPEAPVPVVEVESTDERLGLAANVAANVQSLGGEALLFSVVGDDRPGNRLREILQRQRLSTEYLLCDQARPTTTKLRVMSGQHHVVRVDYENRTPVSSQFLQSHIPYLKKAVEGCDAIVLQDYAKGMVSLESAQLLINLAQDFGKKVIVDPYRSTSLSTYRGVELMTPNRDEAMELARQIAKPEIWRDVKKIGPCLIEAIDAKRMVITLGSEGIMIFEEGQEPFHLPTFAKKVFDVTGAGDTVISAFALGLAAGWDMKACAFFANMAAGVVVGQIGAVACRREDLLASPALTTD